MSWLAAFCPGSFYPVIIVWCENPFYTIWVNRHRGQTLHYLCLRLICRSLFFNAPPSHHTTSPKPCPKRSRAASRPKDVVEFAEDELHRLVLVNHIHRHVAVVPLWAHQGRPKDNADVLCGHSVGIWVFQDSAANKRVESFRYNNFHVNRHHRQQKQLQTEFDICAKITSISSGNIL